jgi:hypothetical protein
MCHRHGAETNDGREAVSRKPWREAIARMRAWDIDSTLSDELDAMDLLANAFEDLGATVGILLRGIPDENFERVSDEWLSYLTRGEG